MQLLSTRLRISISLVCLVVSVLFAARLIGLVPDATTRLIRSRQSLCEAIAINCSLAAERGELEWIEQSLTTIVQRNPEIHAAAVITSTQRRLIETARDHAGGKNRDRNGATEVVNVPISASGVPWGIVELKFEPLIRPAGWAVTKDPFFRMVLFVAAVTCLVYSLYLRRILQHLDPSKVVPERVRMTLDTLAEGLIVIDREERIVLANQAFAEALGVSAAELQGRSAAVLPWMKWVDDQAGGKDFPWSRSIREGRCQTGDVLRMQVEGRATRTFKVNAAPVLDDRGNCQGALTSFDDITALEKRNAQLTDMLQRLQQSRDKIRKQNRELEVLATRDPLTSALNRRSFFECFEKQWLLARRQCQALSCVMVDVDHFKSVNDNHGHSVGDVVLQKVAAALHESVRENDVVCRYGGEEFCILLPVAPAEQAAQAAERYRRAIESISVNAVSVTASLGVSSMELGAETPQQLLDQADKCLYVAKRGGRNRVIRWDEVPADTLFSPSDQRRTTTVEELEVGESIPFQSVTALISALAYRDADTAEHSRRVADLCVAVAHRMMSLREAYILENAALLHDIGKIGVPDSILLKPGALTEDEWKVMSTHDRIGVEIIRSTFACDQLTEIVQAHHFTYAPDPRHPELPSGKDIPLEARILTICDAYDAMVSDRVYRKGRSQQEAIAELRRCAGRQFDPDLVERVIEVVTARDENRCPTVSAVSKKTALRIGVQIERIAQALDSRDIRGLEALAGRLKATATKAGVSSIAELARQLEDLLSGDEDWVNVLSVTVELLELCRATQRSYIMRDVDTDEPAYAGSRERDTDGKRLAQSS